jgi:PAS domain-containing protein
MRMLWDHPALRPTLFALLLLATGIALWLPAARWLGWLALAATLLLAALVLRDGRSATRRQGALQQLEQILSGESEQPPLATLTQLALQVAPDASAATFYLVDAHGQLQYGRPSLRNPLAMTAPVVAPPALAQRALQERRPLQAQQLAPGAALNASESIAGLTPLFAAPLAVHGVPMGVLVLSGPPGGRWNASQEPQVVLVAQTAGILLREEQLRVALQEDLPQDGTILNAMSDPVVVLDQHDHIVLHNPALAGILGPDLGALRGARLQVNNPDPRIQRLAYLVGDATGDRPTRRRLTIDEPIRATLEIETSAVRDRGGRRLRVVAMHDVTSSQVGLEAQTLLLRATAEGLQEPLAALSSAPAQGAMARHAQRLERLRQDLEAVAEPMENLAHSASTTAPWGIVRERLLAALPRNLARRLTVHAHPALDQQAVPERWLGHLLLTLVEETGRREQGRLGLDVEGTPGEMVFSVRITGGGTPPENEENSLGFEANQSTLSLHVARRLAEALGGYLWEAQDTGALRYQLILPTVRIHRQGS